MSDSARLCSLDMCGRRHARHGYCQTHATRFLRDGHPGPVNIKVYGVDVACCVDDCSKKAVGRGYCSIHLGRLRRTGKFERTIARGPANGNWKGDEVKYPGVHARVVRAFGRAHTHTCRHCDRQAHAWAYDHLDPDQRVCDVSGLKYSLDINRYMPLCQSCHMRLDYGTTNNRIRIVKKGSE